MLRSGQGVGDTGREKRGSLEIGVGIWSSSETARNVRSHGTVDGPVLIRVDDHGREDIVAVRGILGRDR